MPTTIIHCPQLSEGQLATLTQALGDVPQCHGSHYRLKHSGVVSLATLEALRSELAVDINILPEKFAADAVRLLITDMDSTLITIECVDEIADFIGVKPQVAAITEAAMRGELDFAASLTRRVALLEGLDEAALGHV